MTKPNEESGNGSRATHRISEAFMTALENENGCLNPLLKAVQDDHTLMLGLRGKYVSIYYRGGELLKIEEKKEKNDPCYRTTFNSDYGRDGKLAERLTRYGGIEAVNRKKIVSYSDTTGIVDAFGELKRLMDIHTKIRSGHEREFQQLVVRENNRARSAGASDYFITDMEHANGDARLDMLGVRWRHNERKHGDKLVPVLFEMKYGEAALAGSAGVEEHLRDIVGRLFDPEFRRTLCANVAAQFKQLNELGLLKFNKSKSIKSFTACDDEVQVVLVLAGCNPRSNQLAPILKEIEKAWAECEGKLLEVGVKGDLRIFQASFCGYAMHEATMLTIPQVLRKCAD